MKKLLLLLLLLTFLVSAQTADDYYKEAKKQADKKYYWDAIPNYKKAIELDSTKLDYYWFLSEAILRENVRGSHRTDAGIFEGLELLNKMIEKGASSVKIYERIARANEVVLNDYKNRYDNFKPNKTPDWQDDKLDFSEKEKFKKIAQTAYVSIKNSYNKILELDPENTSAKSSLKYLKKPF